MINANKNKNYYVRNTKYDKYLVKKIINLHFYLFQNN